MHTLVMVSKVEFFQKVPTREHEFFLAEIDSMLHCIRNNYVCNVIVKLQANNYCLLVI